MKQVLDKVALAIHRYKTKGKKLQVKDIFRKWKKDVVSMIRQIEFPLLFISLSAAETKWPELLIAFRELDDKKIYSSPINEFADYLMILEFVRRGSVHIHRFAYIKDVPQYEVDT